MYILAADRERPDYAERYRSYLDNVKPIFPPQAWELANSDWYFSPTDHRCPHDAWLESFTIDEPSSGERNEKRTTSARIRLVGAYHDCEIEFLYPAVFSYSLTCADASRGHRDWRYDEFRLSERGNLVHEIEWRGREGAARWIIETADIEFRWLART